MEYLSSFEKNFHYFFVKSNSYLYFHPTSSLFSDLFPSSSFAPRIFVHIIPYLSIPHEPEKLSY
jgi:hypothetical protein